MTGAILVAVGILFVAAVVVAVGLGVVAKRGDAQEVYDEDDGP